MRRIKNGEPVFHKHECPESRKGKQMTAEELHDFAVQCLMQEYEETNAEVVRYDKVNAAQPDFCFVNDGRRPNFTTDGEKSVNVLVVCKDDFDGDISDINPAWLLQDYRLNGIFPRITFASAWCAADESKDGKPAICGADFCFKYYSVSALPGEENQELESKLSPVALAAKYAEAWKHFDASIVEPYLDKDFHYASDWVFDEMPCRAEFMEYFKSKLASFKRANDQTDLSIGRNHQTGQVCLMLNQGDLAALVFETKDGRITSARMQEYCWKFKPYDYDDVLYMNHGDHLDAIMPAHVLIKDRLGDIIEKSDYWKKTRTQVTTDDNMYEEMTDVFSLSYGEGSMKLLTIVANDKKENVNMFISIYPVCKGVPVEVLIDKVIEWDNQLEATILCSVGEIEFAFFAVDYYCNKRKYVVGQTLTIDLAALAMRAKEAQRSFSFEGQKAIDWLAKSGRTPTYDANGNVEPVRFNMESMVAFLNTDSKCPDEAQFQSPVESIESTSILGIDFFKTKIMIGRRHTENGELAVSVPLYFRQEFFPMIKEGDPVSGWLWVTGSIAGQHEQDKKNSKAEEKNPLGKMAAKFEDFMRKSNFRCFANIMFVLDELPLLKIRDGYELDAFKVGGRTGASYQAYCCKKNSDIRYDPSDGVAYDDSMYIQGLISCQEAESVPDYMPYFSVPFTEEGIMQAWLLRKLKDFMPLDWHACYNMKTYVFETSRIENMFSSERTGDYMKVRRQVMDIDLETLLPKVTIEGDSATLEYAYWNDWCGLVKVSMDVEKQGDKVVFGKPKGEVLVAYESGLRF